MDVPRLVSFDLNRTLAVIDGVSQGQHIESVSPLPPEEVRAVLYGELRLKTLWQPEDLTDELAEQACRRLGISREDLGFGVKRLTPYRLLPDAKQAVALVAEAGLTVVVLANTSVFSLYSDALAPVATGLALNMEALHLSCTMGVAKPDLEMFRRAAAEHGVAVQDLVHVGDSWKNDIAPALAVGARAIWVNPRNLMPGSDPVPAGRLIVAGGVLDAARALLDRWLQPFRGRP